MAHSSAMRLFIAIPIPDTVAGELAALVKRLQQPDDELRWAAPETWHVTLQFLGAASDAQYACVVRTLGAVALPQFEVRLGELGFFERAGIFHVGVECTPELATLQQQVVAATGQCGFEAEARAYNPHITLARNRGRGPGIRRLKARVGKAPQFTAFTAGEFRLYESFPHSSGSRYEVRARFPLP